MSEVLPETPVKVAVIVVEPRVTLVARPFEPPALEIVATPVADDAQVTEVVMSAFVASE